MKGEDNYVVDEDDSLRVVGATTCQTDESSGHNIRTSTQNLQQEEEEGESGDAVSSQPSLTKVAENAGSEPSEYVEGGG